MKLTPLDIRKQEFTRRLRGYDPDEVHAFLQALSSQWESHLEDIRRQEERVRDLENKLQHYERVEEALQEALQTARESSRQALQAAEQKAQQIRSQAEIDADRIKRDAEQDRTRLRQETQSILGRRKEIVARLRAFLITEMEMLAHFDGDDPVGYIKLMPSDRRQLNSRDEDDDAYDVSSPVQMPSLADLEDDDAFDDAFDEEEAAPVSPAQGAAGGQPTPGQASASAGAASQDESLGERLLRLDEEADPAGSAGTAQKPTAQQPADSAEEAPAAGFWMPGQGLYGGPATESEEASGEGNASNSPAGGSEEAEQRTPWRQRPFFEAPGTGGSTPEPSKPSPEPSERPASTAEDEIARIRRILQDLE